MRDGDDRRVQPAFHDTHHVVLQRQQALAIRRDGRRGGRRDVASRANFRDDEAGVVRIGRRGRHRAGAPRATLRKGARLDPRVRVEVGFVVVRHPAPRRYRGEGLVEEPDVDLHLVPAAPDPVGPLPHGVRTGHDERTGVVRPARMVHLEAAEDRGVVDRHLPALFRVEVDDRHVAVRPVEVPEQRFLARGESGPAAFAELPPRPGGQVGDAGGRPGEQRGGGPSVGGQLKAVGRHRPGVPDDFGDRRIVQAVAADRRVRRRVGGHLVGADVDPLRPVRRIGPDLEAESVGKPPEPGSVPVDRVDGVPAADGEDDRRPVRRDQRLRIACGFAQDHALAPAVPRVVRHEHELVPQADEIGAVSQVAGPGDAQTRQGGAGRSVADRRRRGRLPIERLPIHGRACRPRGVRLGRRRSPRPGRFTLTRAGGQRENQTPANRPPEPSHPFMLPQPACRYRAPCRHAYVRSPA